MIERNRLSKQESPECGRLRLPLPLSGFRPSSWASHWMIYVAELLYDLKILPIHTAPVTAPLPVRLLKTKPSVQNGNFLRTYRIEGKKGGSDPFRGKTGENADI